MKKISLIIIFLSLLPNFAFAQLNTFQGGTGSTSPSGILYGNSTIRLKTVTIGSNLTFSSGILSATGGNTFSWTPLSWGVSTSTTLGFLQGFLSTASSTINSAFRLPTLSQGFAYIGTGGLVNSTASSSINLSWFNNNAGFLTSALQSYDAWTHPAYGGSATTSLLTSTGGLLSTASSTINASSTVTGVLTASGGIYGNLTGLASLATALNANGANCGAGNSPLGVDTSGAVESCFDVWTEAENTSAGYTTNTGTVTNIATTFPILGGPITTTGTLTFGGLSTSSPLAAGAAVLYATGVNTLASIATTTLTASSPLSLSNTVWKVGGSNSTLTLDTSGAWSGTASSLAANGANCAAGNYPLGVNALGAVEDCTAAGAGTVTSIATTWPITGGTITTTGTLGFNGLSTSTNPTTGQLPYWTGVNTFGSVATGTISVPTGLTITANRSAVGGAAAIALDTGYVIPLQSTLDAKALGATTLTIAGTAGQITSSAGAQDISANRTWTLSLPSFVQISNLTLTDSTTTRATSTNATSTNFFATTASTTNLSVGNSLSIFGTLGTALSDFCTKITGGAGLCDGSDDGGAGTSAFEIATTTDIAVPNLAYFTQTSGRTTLGSVATGTVSGTNGITVTGSRYAVGGALAIDCTVSSGSAAGCLASADWTTFNNKQATISATWPITLTGAAVGFNGLSTSSAAVIGNIPYFSGVNTFANVATSSLVQSTGINIANGTSAYVLGSQPTFTIDQSFTPTWTGAHIFNSITRSTTTQATTTTAFFTTASTTNFFGADLQTCNSTTGKITWSGGKFSCGTDFNTGGGGSDPFTHPSAGIFATTTNFIIGSSATASSTLIGNLNITGNSTTTQATTTNFFSTTLTATTGFFTNLWIGVDTLAEYISDTAGAFFTGNTETGITVTYQDADNTVDVVCDTASGSVFGCLSSTDWNTFNGKDSVVTAGDALTRTVDDIDFDGGTAPGGSLGGTWGSPTIDDLFLLNNGDVGTGVFDFGGATSLEIPNGTPAFSAIGQVGLDTTDHQLIVATSTGVSDIFIIPSRQRLWAATVASTSVEFVSGGRLWLPPQRDGFDVVEIHCAVDGGTSVAIVLSNSGGTTDSESLTCDADGAVDTSIDTNALYAAGSLNSLEFGTVTGAVDYLTFSIYGVYTRE